MNNKGSKPQIDIFKSEKKGENSLVSLPEDVKKALHKKWSYLLTQGIADERFRRFLMQSTNLSKRITDLKKGISKGKFGFPLEVTLAKDNRSFFIFFEPSKKEQSAEAYIRLSQPLKEERIKVYKHRYEGHYVRFGSNNSDEKKEIHRLYFQGRNLNEIIENSVRFIFEQQITSKYQLLQAECKQIMGSNFSELITQFEKENNQLLSSAQKTKDFATFFKQNRSFLKEQLQNRLEKSKHPFLADPIQKVDLDLDKLTTMFDKAIFVVTNKYQKKNHNGNEYSNTKNSGATPASTMATRVSDSIPKADDRATTEQGQKHPIRRGNSGNATTSSGNTGKGTPSSKENHNKAESTNELTRRKQSNHPETDSTTGENGGTEAGKVGGSLYHLPGEHIGNRPKPTDKPGRKGGSTRVLEDSITNDPASLPIIPQVLENSLNFLKSDQGPSLWEMALNAISESGLTVDQYNELRKAIDDNQAITKSGKKESLLGKLQRLYPENVPSTNESGIERQKNLTEEEQLNVNDPELTITDTSIEDSSEEKVIESLEQDNITNDPASLPIAPQVLENSLNFLKSDQGPSLWEMALNAISESSLTVDQYNELRKAIDDNQVITKLGKKESLLGKLQRLYPENVPSTNGPSVERQKNLTEEEQLNVNDPELTITSTSIEDKSNVEDSSEEKVIESLEQDNIENSPSTNGPSIGEEEDINDFFHIDKEEQAKLLPTTSTGKIVANLDAIHLLKKIEEDQSFIPKKDDLLKLAKFSGWGAIGNTYLNLNDHENLWLVEKILPAIFEGKDLVLEKGSYYRKDVKFYKGYSGFYVYQDILVPLTSVDKEKSRKIIDFDDSEQIIAYLQGTLAQLEEELRNKIQFKVNPPNLSENKSYKIGKDQWRKALVKYLLNKKEYQQALTSTLTSFYTPPEIISSIWDVIGKHLGFQGGSVAEFSAGTGNIVGLQPLDLRQKSHWHVVEPDSIPAKILSVLYPQQVTLVNTGIEKMQDFTPRPTLAFTNVPFGKTSPYDKHFPELKSFTLEDYCIARNLLALQEGGILIAVTSYATLDRADSRFRRWVNNEGEADLLTALRLPNNTFKKVAGTSITTDILIFAKREQGKKHPLAKDFLSLSLHRESRKQPDYTDKKHKKAIEQKQPIAVENSNIYINEYFKKHPEHLLGTMVLAHEDRGRGQFSYNEPSCVSWNSEVLEKKLNETKHKLTQGQEPWKKPLLEYYLELYTFFHDKLNQVSEQQKNFVSQPLGEQIAEKLRESLPANLLGQVSALTKGQITKNVPDTKSQQALEKISDKWWFNLTTKELFFRYQLKGGANNWKEYKIADAHSLIAIVEKEKGIRRKVHPVNMVRSFEKLKKAFFTLNDLEQSKDPKDINGQELIDVARKELNKNYDNFIQVYGLLHHPGYRSKQQVTSKNAILKNDDDFYLLKTLEQEITTSTPNGQVKFSYQKARIFSERLLFPAKDPEKAQNIQDALVNSEVFKGKVDLAYIASQLEVSQKEAVKLLLAQDLVFKNPSTRKYELGEAYLSGYVRDKLELAKQAAQADPDTYQRNVKALEKVQPKEKLFFDIGFTLGAPFIPAEVVKDYAKEVLDYDLEVTYVSEASRWVVKLPKNKKEKDLKVSEFCTPRISAFRLLKHSLNLSDTIINDKTTDPQTNKPKQEKNIAATEEALDRKAALKESFHQFVLDNEKYHLDIQAKYNELYGGFTPRKWTDLKVDLYPGMSNAMIPMPHQKKGVRRALAQNTLICYDTGLGKSLISQILAMEQNRLFGWKVLMVVPNKTIEQFGSSFKQVYPTSQLLIARSGMSSEERKNFYARAAFGDYQVVVMTYEQLKVIPDHPDDQVNYINEEIEIQVKHQAAYDTDSTEYKEIQHLIATLKDEISEIEEKRVKRNIKREAQKSQTLSAHLEAQLDRNVDKTLYFRDFNFGAISFDEPHAYIKKPGIPRTSLRYVRGVDTAGSKMAISAMLKIRHIHEKHGVGKGVTFLTATPITNTLAESHTILRFQRPDLLANSHITSFDNFARTFGKIVKTLEQTTSGSYNIVNYFAEYKNLSEYLPLFHELADVLFASDIPELASKNEHQRFVPGVSLPKIEGGKIESVILPRSPFQKRMTEEFASILNHYKHLDAKYKKALSHIHMVLGNQANCATTDLRLLRGANNPITETPYEGRLININDPLSKSNQVIEYLTDIYFEQEEEQTLGVQAVFCGRYQSSDKTFNVFHYIKEELVKRGVPASQIAIITEKEYAKGSAREKLFDEVNEAKVRIVLGTYKKMGFGVNMQRHLSSLLLLDLPDLPDELKQAVGRIIRQGNLNETVRVLSFAVKGSMDVNGIERLARKTNFINELIKPSNTLDSYAESSEKKEMIDYLSNLRVNLANNALFKERLVKNIELKSSRSKLRSIEHQRFSWLRRIKDIQFQMSLLEGEKDWTLFDKLLKESPSVDRDLSNFEINKVDLIQPTTKQAYTLIVQTEEEIVKQQGLWRLGAYAFSQKIEVRFQHPETKKEIVNKATRSKLLQKGTPATIVFTPKGEYPMETEKPFTIKHMKDFVMDDINYWGENKGKKLPNKKELKTFLFQQEIISAMEKGEIWLPTIPFGSFNNETLSKLKRLNAEAWANGVYKTPIPILSSELDYYLEKYLRKLHFQESHLQETFELGSNIPSTLTIKFNSIPFEFHSSKNGPWGHPQGIDTYGSRLNLNNTHKIPRDITRMVKDTSKNIADAQRKLAELTLEKNTLDQKLANKSSLNVTKEKVEDLGLQVKTIEEEMLNLVKEGKAETSISLKGPELARKAKLTQDEKEQIIQHTLKQSTPLQEVEHSFLDFLLKEYQQNTESKAKSYQWKSKSIEISLKAEPLAIAVNNIELIDGNEQQLVSLEITTRQGQSVPKTDRLTLFYEKNKQGETNYYPYEVEFKDLRVIEEDEKEPEYIILGEPKPSKEKIIQLHQYLYNESKDQTLLFLTKPADQKKISEEYIPEVIQPMQIMVSLNDQSLNDRYAAFIKERSRQNDAKDEAKMREQEIKRDKILANLKKQRVIEKALFDEKLGFALPEKAENFLNFLIEEKFAKQNKDSNTIYPSVKDHYAPVTIEKMQLQGLALPAWRLAHITPGQGSAIPEIFFIQNTGRFYPGYLACSAEEVSKYKENQKLPHKDFIIDQTFFEKAYLGAHQLHDPTSHEINSSKKELQREICFKFCPKWFELMLKQLNLAEQFQRYIAQKAKKNVTIQTQVSKQCKTGPFSTTNMTTNQENQHTPSKF